MGDVGRWSSSLHRGGGYGGIPTPAGPSAITTRTGASSPTTRMPGPASLRPDRAARCRARPRAARAPRPWRTPRRPCRAPRASPRPTGGTGRCRCEECQWSVMRWVVGPDRVARPSPPGQQAPCFHEWPLGPSCSQRVAGRPWSARFRAMELDEGKVKPGPSNLCDTPECGTGPSDSSAPGRAGSRRRPAGDGNDGSGSRAPSAHQCTTFGGAGRTGGQTCRHRATTDGWAHPSYRRGQPGAGSQSDQTDVSPSAAVPCPTPPACPRGGRQPSLPGCLGSRGPESRPAHRRRRTPPRPRRGRSARKGHRGTRP